MFRRRAVEVSTRKPVARVFQALMLQGWSVRAGDHVGSAHAVDGPEPILRCGPGNTLESTWS